MRKMLHNVDLLPILASSAFQSQQGGSLQDAEVSCAHLQFLGGAPNEGRDGVRLHQGQCETKVPHSDISFQGQGTETVESHWLQTCISINSEQGTTTKGILEAKGIVCKALPRGPWWVSEETSLLEKLGCVLAVKVLSGFCTRPAGCGEIQAQAGGSWNCSCCPSPEAQTWALCPLCQPWRHTVPLKKEPAMGSASNWQSPAGGAFRVCFSSEPQAMDPTNGPSHWEQWLLRWGSPYLARVGLLYGQSFTHAPHSATTVL